MCYIARAKKKSENSAGQASFAAFGFHDSRDIRLAPFVFCTAARAQRQSSALGGAHRRTGMLRHRCCRAGRAGGHASPRTPAIWFLARRNASQMKSQSAKHFRPTPRAASRVSYSLDGPRFVLRRLACCAAASRARARAVMSLGYWHRHRKSWCCGGGGIALGASHAAVGSLGSGARGHALAAVAGTGHRAELLDRNRAALS